MDCPNCNSEHTQRASVIHSAGTSTISMVSATTGTAWGTGGSATFSGTTTSGGIQQTALARRFQPPHARKGYAFLVAIPFLILMMFQYWGFSATHYPLHALAVGIALIGCVPIFWSTLFYDRTILPVERARYSQTWHCNRCGSVFFEPSAPAISPVQQREYKSKNMMAVLLVLAAFSSIIFIVMYMHNGVYSKRSELVFPERTLRPVAVQNQPIRLREWEKNDALRQSVNRKAGIAMVLSNATPLAENCTLPAQSNVELKEFALNDHGVGERYVGLVLLRKDQFDSSDGACARYNGQVEPIFISRFPRDKIPPQILKDMNKPPELPHFSQSDFR